jgi:ATP citrate (pro-S)-lyase
MARRKICEYDTKKLMMEHLPRLSGIKLNLRSVQITPDTDFSKLVSENPWLKQGPLVVKPDMLFGRRGKNKLLLLKASFDEAKEFLRKKMGQEIEIKTVKGPITRFIVEPFIAHKEEYYLSILSKRDEDSISFSISGGIHVEENWEKMIQVSVPIGKDIDDASLVTSIDGKLPPERKEKTIAFIKAAYKLFADLNFTLLEMNPFTFDRNGNPIPLDMRGEVDDTASFKNMHKWNGLKFPQPFGRKLHPEEKLVREMDEKTGASLKLTILNPKGRIWTMVAGGGASVIYTDTIADLGFGDELGNYGEYSGNPNEEETYQYARLILDLATRHTNDRGRALLIGGGIANFTDVAKTFKGIIRALKEYKVKLRDTKTRIYVRRGGPNYQAGLKMMKELGKDLGVPVEVYGPETSMTGIVPLAIDYIKSG